MERIFRLMQLLMATCFLESVCGQSLFSGIQIEQVVPGDVQQLNASTCLQQLEVERQDLSAFLVLVRQVASLDILEGSTLFVVSDQVVTQFVSDTGLESSQEILQELQQNKIIENHIVPEFSQYFLRDLVLPFRVESYSQRELVFENVEPEGLAIRLQDQDTINKFVDTVPLNDEKCNLKIFELERMLIDEYALQNGDPSGHFVFERVADDQQDQFFYPAYSTEVPFEGYAADYTPSNFTEEAVPFIEDIVSSIDQCILEYIENNSNWSFALQALRETIGLDVLPGATWLIANNDAFWTFTTAVNVRNLDSWFDSGENQDILDKVMRTHILPNYELKPEELDIMFKRFYETPTLYDNQEISITGVHDQLAIIAPQQFLYSYVVSDRVLPYEDCDFQVVEIDMVLIPDLVVEEANILAPILRQTKGEEVLPTSYPRTILNDYL